jgi:hypothetical protein
MNAGDHDQPQDPKLFASRMRNARGSDSQGNQGGIAHCESPMASTQQDLFPSSTAGMTKLISSPSTSPVSELVNRMARRHPQRLTPARRSQRAVQNRRRASQNGSTDHAERSPRSATIPSRGGRNAKSSFSRLRFWQALRYLSFMAEISMVVTSIDPLAPYKFSDDLILELVGVTATLEDPLEAVPDPCWIQIVEPHDLVKHQPDGGYIFANRRVQMTFLKSAGVRLSDRMKFRILNEAPPPRENF